MPNPCCADDDDLPCAGYSAKLSKFTIFLGIYAVNDRRSSLGIVERIC